MSTNISLAFDNLAQFVFSKSKSQIGQDFFVLSELDFKNSGYFVGFGATNGLDLSNTYMLEKEFNWTGILAEPALCWHKDLKMNRQCKIDTRCVWSESNKVLTFNETIEPVLSTIADFSSSDVQHSKLREGGKHYDVMTISLNDLLAEHSAPFDIDYLSIDTEGSEFEILSSLNFEKYDIKVITCEHNYTPARVKIHDLLTSKGYVRTKTDISQFDDWYIKLKPEKKTFYTYSS
jgi:FkbM family methyltransferase